MIVVNYLVDAGTNEAFIEAMEELRVVRRRSGATRWPSWGGYIRQRARYTAADLRMLEAATALHSGPGEPEVTWFIHPESVLAYRRLARWRRLRGVDPALTTDDSTGAGRPR